MGEDIKFTIGGDSAQAVAALKAVVAGQEEVIKKLQEGAKTSKEAAREQEIHFKGIASSIGAVASSLGLAGGVAGALSLVVGQTEKWNATLTETAERIRAAVNESMNLALLGEQGGAASAQWAATTGALSGIAPGEAKRTLFEMRAIAGSMAGGKAATRSVFDLVKLGNIPIGEAREAVEGMMAAEVPHATAANLLFTAGQITGQGVGAFTGVGSRAGMFKDVSGGAGEAVILAAALKALRPGEDPVPVLAQVRLALEGAGSDKWARLVRSLPSYTKPGEGPQDIEGLLGDLRGRGLIGAQALGLAGLGAKQQAAVLDLLSPRAAATMGALRAAMAGPSRMLAAHQAALASIPGGVEADEIAQREAMMEAEVGAPVTDAESATNRAAITRDLADVRMAHAAQRAGYGVAEGKRFHWGIRALSDPFSAAFWRTRWDIIARGGQIFNELEAIQSIPTAGGAGSSPAELREIAGHLKNIDGRGARGAQNYAPETPTGR